MRGIRPRVVGILAGLCLAGEALAAGPAGADGPPATTSTVVTLPTTSTTAAPTTLAPAMTSTTAAPTTSTTAAPATTTTTVSPTTTTVTPTTVAPTTVAPTTTSTTASPPTTVKPGATSTVVGSAASPGLESDAITYQPKPGFSGTATFDHKVCEPSNPGSAEQMCVTSPVQVTVTADGQVLDVLRATPVDPTVPTSLYAATAFLYAGADPVQKDVAPATIDRRRASVLRGAVLNGAGEPVAGVRVSVQDHPELGHTSTRANGMFDLVVNGGGTVVISYEKDGMETSHRRVAVPWSRYVWIPLADPPEGPAAGPAPDLPPPTPTAVPVPGPTESVDVAGTPFALRAPAAPTRTLSIPVTGADLPASLTGVELTVTVAGARRSEVLAPTADQVHEFTWDGRDGYGRVVQGRVDAEVTVTYLYGEERRPGTPRTSLTPLGTMDPAGQGLGGWSLDVQGVLDVDHLLLFQGDGTERPVRHGGAVQEAGAVEDLRIEAVAAAPDGSLYVSAGNRVGRLAPDGTMTTVAGSGAWGSHGDGGPATAAAFRGPTAIAVGGDGDLFVLDRWNHRVRRIAPDGTITSVAGGDMDPPASLGEPIDIAIGDDGRLYVLDGQGGRLLEAGTDDRVRVLAELGPSFAAGGGSITAGKGEVFLTDSVHHRILAVAGDGSTRALAEGQVTWPRALSTGGDGSIVFVDGGKVQQLNPRGELTTMATAAPPPDSDEASDAESSSMVLPHDLTTGPDGVLSLAARDGLFRIGTSLVGTGPGGELVARAEDGAVEQIFDVFGRHLRTVDVAGGAVRHEFGYDAQGRLTDVTAGDGGVTRITRDENGEAITFTAPGGQRSVVRTRAGSIVPSVRGTDIPAVVLKAYSDAAAAARRSLACDIRWSVLAAVGRTESNHGRFGGSLVRTDGGVLPPIVGMALDGRPGIERILDSDGGGLDGDTVFDRAVGPMQILPSTWRSVAADGNGDGVADPHNTYDAALGAARYLCQGATSFSDRSELSRALHRYNRSDAYVTRVLADVDFYDRLDPTGAASRAPYVYALPVHRALIADDPRVLDQPHHTYPAWDMPLPTGAPVYAVANGRVVAVDPGGDCGRGVVVDGTDGYRYAYCHADASRVRAGAAVVAGQLIMVSGSTGHSTGPHLHLQIERPDGTKLCPQTLLRAWYRGQGMSPASAPSAGCTS